MISMYKTSFEDRTYFLYWLPDPKVIGVCDGVNEIYELAVSEKQRAEFVNVSETILPSIWRESMDKKLFTISSISPKSRCIISFTTKRTFTLKVNQDLSRLAFIMEEMLKSIETLIVDKNKQKQPRVKKSVSDVPVKRRKAPRRGIQWDED
ncbi:hypothetical protein TELCIR_01003 [Teladorsagia circumcincta]|uniref:Uncharacterized protein n=1 Tax=Teladorsagia circumcincta TaxID=45464 RepID=A0A2G9V335_TELCI|nr:hypothetical protein TELCIR_01003 [Teladorsagia circumcincta]